MTSDHEHGLKCTGCNVTPGECCRHCPAAIAAADAAARPNARMRAAALELLELADRASVEISFAIYAAPHDPGKPSLMHVQGQSGERHMLLTDALRIALRCGDVVRREPTPECPHSALEFTLPVSGTPVSVICEPTWAQDMAAGLAAVLS